MESVPRFQLTYIDERDMTPEQEAALRDLLCECFPADVGAFSQTRAWHGSGPEYTLAYFEEGRALGHVGIVVREIACDDLPVKIAGVQNVAVTPSRRGAGLSRQLMEAAMEEAARRGLSFGLLFCVSELARFYSSLGWVRKDIPVTMVDDNGADVPTDPKNLLLVKELSGEPFTAREVHLQGADW